MLGVALEGLGREQAGELCSTGCRMSYPRWLCNLAAGAVLASRVDTEVSAAGRVGRMAALTEAACDLVIIGARAGWRVGVSVLLVATDPTKRSTAK